MLAWWVGDLMVVLEGPKVVPLVPSPKVTTPVLILVQAGVLFAKQ